MHRLIGRRGALRLIEPATSHRCSIAVLMLLMPAFTSAYAAIRPPSARQILDDIVPVSSIVKRQAAAQTPALSSASNTAASSARPSSQASSAKKSSSASITKPSTYPTPSPTVPVTSEAAGDSSGGTSKTTLIVVIVVAVIVAIPLLYFAIRLYGKGLAWYKKKEVTELPPPRPVSSMSMLAGGSAGRRSADELRTRRNSGMYAYNNSSRRASMQGSQRGSMYGNNTGNISSPMLSSANSVHSGTSKRSPVSTSRPSSIHDWYGRDPSTSQNYRPTSRNGRAYAPHHVRELSMPLPLAPPSAVQADARNRSMQFGAQSGIGSSLGLENLSFGEERPASAPPVQDYKGKRRMYGSAEMRGPFAGGSSAEASNQSSPELLSASEQDDARGRRRHSQPLSSRPMFSVSPGQEDDEDDNAVTAPTSQPGTPGSPEVFESPRASLDLNGLPIPPLQLRIPSPAGSGTTASVSGGSGGSSGTSQQQLRKYPQQQPFGGNGDYLRGNGEYIRPTRGSFGYRPPSLHLEDLLEGQMMESPRQYAIDAVGEGEDQSQGH